jgi:hypothetical protein
MQENLQDITVLDSFGLAGNIRHILVRVSEAGKPSRIVCVVTQADEIVGKSESSPEFFQEEKIRFRNSGLLRKIIDNPEDSTNLILDGFQVEFSDGIFRFLHVEKTDNWSGIKSLHLVKMQQKDNQNWIMAYNKIVSDKGQFARLKRQLKSVRIPLVLTINITQEIFHICDCGGTIAVWDDANSWYRCEHCRNPIIDCDNVFASITDTEGKK